MSLKSQMSGGFTLVEVLVSIALIGTVGTIVFVTFATSLRGAQKTAALATVRQNGDYALNQMTKNIRFSASAVVGSAANGFATYCVSPSPLSSNIYLKTTEPDGSQTTYTCGTNITSINTKSTLQTYLDTTKVAIAPAASCYFSCTQGLPSDPPEVSINFSLTQATSTGSTGTSVTIPFHTTVLLRNFQR